MRHYCQSVQPACLSCWFFAWPFWDAKLRLCQTGKGPVAKRSQEEAPEPLKPRHANAWAARDVFLKRPSQDGAPNAFGTHVKPSKQRADLFTCLIHSELLRTTTYISARGSVITEVQASGNNAMRFAKPVNTDWPVQYKGLIHGRSSKAIA